jgi:uncharacterized protein (TIGR03089 family)
MRPAVDLSERARRDGAGPLITFYDDATGERIELSGITTLNWVAKVCALLREELWLDSGEEVGIDLPLHWQAAVVTLASWAAGGVPVQGSARGRVAFVVAGATSEADETVALSLRPLGGRITEALPPHWHDFAAVVPGQPDALDAVSPPTVVAPPTELPPGSRVLSTVWDPDLALLAPLACGGSVVLVRNPRDDLAALAAAERVTHTVGHGVQGLPRLDG